MPVMKMSQFQTDKKIKQNRINIRKNIKLSINFAQNRSKLCQLPIIDANNPQKPHNIIKIDASNQLNTKQFILGNFEYSYQLKQKIGQGAHATVYRCIQRATQKEYAVKITRQGDQQLMYSTKQQFKILKKLNHENIIRAQSFYIDKIKMTTYLICQLCPYKQLAVYLRNRNLKNICFAYVTNIILKLIQTLCYLHKVGVCHRDIKPENILYDPITQNIKLIDFDCSKLKKQSDQNFQMWTKTGSLYYQAPQYFQQVVYNQKIDVWAAGVIFFELITGNLPFKSNYYQSLIQMITKKAIDFEKLGIPVQYKVLLKKMLKKNPQRRISAQQCSRLPVLLKKQLQHKITQTSDDFKVDLKNHSFIRDRQIFELKDQNQHRKRQLSLGKKDPPKQLLKYFCFVGDL